MISPRRDPRTSSASASSSRAQNGRRRAEAGHAQVERVVVGEDVGRAATKTPPGRASSRRSEPERRWSGPAALRLRPGSAAVARRRADAEPCGRGSGPARRDARDGLRHAGSARRRARERRTGPPGRPAATGPGRPLVAVVTARSIMRPRIGRLAQLGRPLDDRLEGARRRPSPGRPRGPARHGGPGPRSPRPAPSRPGRRAARSPDWMRPVRARDAQRPAGRSAAPRPRP